MPQDRVTRQPVRLRGRRRRTPGEHLMLQVPAIVRLSGRAFQRLPAGSRLRRALVVRRMRQIYEAFNRDDMELFLLLGNHPAVELHTAKDQAGVPFGADLESVYSGHEGILHALREWAGAWDGYRVETDEVIDCGDKLIAFLRHRGHGRGSGVEIDVPFAQVLDLRDGLAVRIENFWDRGKALETVGLRE